MRRLPNSSEAADLSQAVGASSLLLRAISASTGRTAILRTVSQENVEVFRRAFEEFTRGGWEPLFGTVWAPEIVWDMSPAGIAGLGVYQGYDELRSFFEDWFSTFPFDEWEQQLDDVIDCGDEVVVALTRQRGRGAASGVSVELEYAQVMTFREGKIVRAVVYTDREQALKAVGAKD